MGRPVLVRPLERAMVQVLHYRYVCLVPRLRFAIGWVTALAPLAVIPPRNNRDAGDRKYIHRILDLAVPWSAFVDTLGVDYVLNPNKPLPESLSVRHGAIRAKPCLTSCRDASYAYVSSGFHMYFTEAVRLGRRPVPFVSHGAVPAACALPHSQRFASSCIACAVALT